ncbi:MAG: protein-L-isoaspartate O-methyltransferase [Methanosarcinaceae archaeon]|nr:protein-L-isoaspartate O-methyltransferase [Methanosarcinaceae archaeon]
MEYEKEREILIGSLRSHNIKQSVLDAMLRVPRHLFIPEGLRRDAYVDTPLPIGHGQTISAPHMVAIMCDLLDLHEGQRILEIGTGSGYNAAVMAELVGKTGHIYTVERIAPLVDFAKKNLNDTGYTNVTVILEDGSGGYSEFSSYDRITVTCAAPDIPEPLVEQLKPGGLLAIPVGDNIQHLYLVKKDLDGTVHKESKGGVVFVPLIGKYGYGYD